MNNNNEQKNESYATNETDDTVPPGTETTNKGNSEKTIVDLFPSLYSDLS